MKIPVFLSRPTTLSQEQESSCRQITEMLDSLQLEPRTLGRSDYSTSNPVNEVLAIARHCSGGVVLGFRQYYAATLTSKVGTPNAEDLAEVYLPSPWNHLESGILVALGLPLIVLKEQEIGGGVFDAGALDVFIHRLPSFPWDSATRDGLYGVFLKWQTAVRTLYYEGFQLNRKNAPFGTV